MSVSVQVLDSNKVVETHKIPDGQTIILNAKNNVNYQLVNDQTGYAPENILTAREGNDLVITFEEMDKQSLVITKDFANEPSIIIKDYYLQEAPNLLVGLHENGALYAFIPESGLAGNAVTALAEQMVVPQVLGGTALSAATWVLNPWWIVGGLALVGTGVAIATAGGKKSSGGSAATNSATNETNNSNGSEEPATDNNTDPNVVGDDSSADAGSDTGSGTGSGTGSDTTKIAILSASNVATYNPSKLAYDFIVQVKFNPDYAGETTIISIPNVGDVEVTIPDDGVVLHTYESPYLDDLTIIFNSESKPVYAMVNIEDEPGPAYPPELFENTLVYEIEDNKENSVYSYKNIISVEKYETSASDLDTTTNTVLDDVYKQIVLSEVTEITQVDNGKILSVVIVNSYSKEVDIDNTTLLTQEIVEYQNVEYSIQALDVVSMLVQSEIEVI